MPAEERPIISWVSLCISTKQSPFLFSEHTLHTALRLFVLVPGNLWIFDFLYTKDFCLFILTAARVKWDYDNAGENLSPIIFSMPLRVEADCAMFITHEESALAYIFLRPPG